MASNPTASAASAASQQPARSLFGHLIVNPTVGFFQAVAQADRWLPTEQLFDQRIVAVAAINAFRRLEIIRALQLDARDSLNDVHQSIDRYQFAAAQIDWLQNVARENRLRALQAIVNIHEAARLQTVAPNLDLMLAGYFCTNHLAANRRR